MSIIDKYNKYLDKAFNNYKLAYNSENNKFKYLPNWLRFESEIFKKESKGSSRTEFKSYKRGTIIRVDFGVNIGSELCGHHFAIVLKKDDSTYDQTVQCIPLTSKNKSNRIAIDTLILEETESYLHDKLDYIEVQLTLAEFLINNNFKLKFPEKEFELNASPSQTYDLINKLKVDFKNLQKVHNIYSRFNKVSYMCVSDIYTISKERILQINKYDPSGNIAVSNQTLDVIDENIIKLFTK